MEIAAFGGLNTVTQAVEIYEILTMDDFAVHGPGLAKSLNNLSVNLAECGDTAGGLHAIARAVEIYEAVANDNFAMYGPDLGRSLLTYCLVDKLDIKKLERVNTIHLQLIGTCFEAWVEHFPSVLLGFLEQAESEADKNAILAMIDEISTQT
ncbi:MAG: hypothetical protein COA42_14370 [Alteromonadaceae bacterium]|nr:MAG: hypothetical protein COA42_14370 [Alteromonadaceae bacterium]